MFRIIHSIRQRFALATILAMSTVASAGAQSPAIEDFTPRLGAEGTEVVISGAGFEDPGGAATVSIGAIPQDILVASAASLTFRVAAGTESGPIVVETPSGRAVSERRFHIERNGAEHEQVEIQGAPDDEVQGITPSALNQGILVVLVRGHWQSGGPDFATAKMDVLGKANETNRFWSEASYGKTSFDTEVLGGGIFELPRSQQYYYHRAQRRSVQGRPMAASVDFGTGASFKIKSNGVDVLVTFPAGTMVPADVLSSINAAIASVPADAAPPTVSVSLTGSGMNQLSLRSTKPEEVSGKLELEGDALGAIGLGAPGLYGRGDETPARVLFGGPLEKDGVTFPAASDLVVETQGIEVTTVSFPAGNDMTLEEVAQAIRDAYPGEASQQPFGVRVIEDPDDSDRGFLVFETVLGPDDDDGFQLTLDGTAREALGFASGTSSSEGRILRYEAETFRGALAVRDGFRLHAESLPSGTDPHDAYGSAGMFVAYVVEPVGGPGFRAHQGGFSYDILGETFTKDYFADKISNIWQVFAHETGHALGLPDLYRVHPDIVGSVPDSWDMMDCSCDSQPVSYLKSQHHRPADKRDGPWIEEALVLKIDPPPPGGTRIDRTILTPVDAPWTTSTPNPFAALHPGVPVVHAAEFIPTSPADVLVLDARARGPFAGDFLGDVTTSTQLPGSGVIMYQGRHLQTGGLISFLPVNLLTPFANPLDTVGESISHTLTLANSLQARVIAQLDNADSSGGVPAKSFLIETTWGEGSFFDIEIRDWNPPPWESVDIWLDSRAENDWDVYSFAEDAAGTIPIDNGDRVAIKQENRIYARIRNSGDVAIPDDIEVIFTIVLPQRVGDNQETGTGPSDLETEIGRVTIVGGLSPRGTPGSTQVTPPLIWQPQESNEEHVCIRAYVTPVSGERNETANNKAQENITQWYSATSSPFDPVKFEIITEAPWNDRPAPVVIHVPDVPHGWTVALEAQEFILSPGEVMRQTVVITPDFDILTAADPDHRKIVEAFRASIEAHTILGDRFVPFGGTTAVVHPVNRDTVLEITGIAREDQNGRPSALRGELGTGGPLPANIGNRAIDVRFRPSGPKPEQWMRVQTALDGRFIVLVPPSLVGLEMRAQAFHAGGEGLAPAASELFLLPSG